MNAPSGRVVVVGSLNVDLTVTVPRHPRPGETLTGAGGTYAPGGKGANQALAASLAGAPTAMVGAVGSDANAATAASLLRRGGVCLEAVETVPGPTGLAVIAVDEAGENTIVVVPGANGQVSATTVDTHAGTIGEAEVVISQCEIPTEAITATARATKGRFILNLAPATPLPLEVLRRADPLVVNEHEARELLVHLEAASGSEMLEVADGGAGGGEVADGRAGGGEEADAEAGDYERIAARLRSHGIPAVVITLGGDGALVADGDGLTAVPSIRVDVVDTTGAGDAFVGTLGAHLAAGSDLRSATARACRAGALATTAPGAQSAYVHALAERPASARPVSEQPAPRGSAQPR